MHIVHLSAGQGDSVFPLHIRLGAPAADKAHDHFVNLLVLDVRGMSDACLGAAIRAIGDIRAKHGLRHGVLLCAQPALSVVVASIRCGLRDVITPRIGATQLRQLLRSAIPGLTRRECRDAVAFLRAFAGSPGETGDTVHHARRAEALTRRADELAEEAKALALEKDRLLRMEQDLRERTRRLDRQIARMQGDADLPAAGLTNSPFARAGSAAPVPAAQPDFAAMSRRLDQRAAELDLREKLLAEMQTLLLTTPQGAAMGKELAFAMAAPVRVGRAS